MQLVRPHCLRTLAVPLGLLAISMVQPADALAAFHRDKTPLSPTITDQTSTAHATAGGGAAIVRMLVGLVIVIAVILGVYYALKAFGRRTKGGVLRNDGQIEVVASTTLGPNRAVHLLRVGGELVLVGATDGGVTPIRVYGPNEIAEFDPDAPDVAFAPSTPSRKRGTLLEELRKRTAR
jgi:flagellar biosynthetic protein FliO